MAKNSPITKFEELSASMARKGVLAIQVLEILPSEVDVNVRVAEEIGPWQYRDQYGTWGSRASMSKLDVTTGIRRTPRLFTKRTTLELISVERWADDGRNKVIDDYCIGGVYVLGQYVPIRLKIPA